ncbi:hypothetical protein GGS26DRAFT_580676 [Hypomontagnella submonticulosa]|nr:hypothetical protein GGS26DRAFT_580676 [Hypomontagnella submonticulosa]
MADHLALTSPGSSDATMEGRPRPSALAALAFGPNQDLTGLEGVGLFPANRHHADSYRQHGNRLALWYHNNDGPWTPPGLASPQGDMRNPSVLGNLRGSPLVFTHYRESIVPSECDTVAPGVPPSDSGYGGSYGAKHSIANGSVCDESIDRNPETQSLVGHRGDLNFPSYNQDMMSKAGMNPENPWPSSQPPLSPQPAIERRINFEENRECDICHKTLKTKSEFKKHKQRHDKPFKCDVKNCTRREGFSTPNDLDRHKRSLHPDENAAGSRYQCPIGACRNKEKIWPRADNFRAHMKRVHQKELSSDEELDEYKFRPITPSKEPSDQTGASMAPEFIGFSTVLPETITNPTSSWRASQDSIVAKTSPVESPSHIQMVEALPVNKAGSESHPYVCNSTPIQDVHSGNGETSPDNQAEIPRLPPSQPSLPPGETEFMEPRRLKKDTSSSPAVELDPKANRDVDYPNHNPTNRLEDPQDLQDHPDVLTFGDTQLSKQSEGLPSIHEKALTLPEPGSLGMRDTDLTRDEVVKLLEKLRSSGVLGDVLGEFGYRKEDPPEPEVTKQEPANHVSEQSQAHVCPECSKRFNRRCELKKHEKRHLKPYGCTFPDCNKKFGSKNDWKRHENSQHYMVEHWRCDEKQTDDPSEPCGKVIHRRELFKQHLSGWHHIKDPASLERKLDACRIGRNLETRFWCGFCKEVIEIKKQGIEAWTERFNHIDDHFHGRNNQEKKEIDDWKKEYPLSGDELLVDDSENCSITSSTRASANGSKTRSRTGPLKQTQTMKQKRKRADADDMPALKRTDTYKDLPRYHCCSEPLPLTNTQCTNYPCDHKLCENCS